MARILYIGDNVSLAQINALALHAAGHDVDVEHNQFRARDKLDGQPADVVVVDAARLDGGAGLLVQQTRAAWPGAVVLALINRCDPAKTAIGRMGLWDPDMTLVHPVKPDVLADKVARLLEQQAGIG